MDKKETHLIGHLEELRRRIIITLAAFLLFLITAFLFVQDIYDWLIRDLDGKLAVLGPSEILWVYMMLAGICAIAASILLPRTSCGVSLPRRSQKRSAR